MKFRILLNMPKFPTRKQARIIVACMVLHNFFRESRIRGRDFAMCDEYANYNPMPSEHESSDDELDESWDDESLIEDTNMNAFRDEIAAALLNGH